MYEVQPVTSDEKRCERIARRLRQKAKKAAFRKAGRAAQLDPEALERHRLEVEELARRLGM